MSEEYRSYIRWKMLNQMSSIERNRTMKTYVSRRYLKEKWNKLKWDMERVVGVYEDGEDNVAEEANRVSYEMIDFMSAIIKELTY